MKHRCSKGPQIGIARGTAAIAACLACSLNLACSEDAAPVTSDDGALTEPGLPTQVPGGAAAVPDETPTTDVTPASSPASAADPAPASAADPAPASATSSLPAPAVSNVARPEATVITPTLRVLPWAGFTAAVSYTFDDSQPSQAEHWPALEASGVPMTFFINPVNNWQSGYDPLWSAVAESGSEIGNHTWSHCRADLSECDAPIGTVEEEIDQTNDYIVTRLGQSTVLSFAAPFGDSGWGGYAAERFLLARGVASGTVGAAGPSDWHNLPAVAVTEGQTSADFDTAIDDAHGEGAWAIFMFHTIRPTADDWYAGVEIADITASIEHAESREDIWIDTMGEIGVYARGAELLRAADAGAQTSWQWTLPAHFPPGRVVRATVDGGTLSQDGAPLVWDEHGYYEVALDALALTWSAN